jgi:hypothetical protein
MPQVPAFAAPRLPVQFQTARPVAGGLALLILSCATTFTSIACAQSEAPPIAPAAPASSAPSAPSTVNTPRPGTRAPADSKAADPSPELIIATTDGTVLQGIRLTQDDASITLEIAGIPARITRDRITRVRELEPVLTRYKLLRDAAPITEVGKRVELVQWLLERRQLDLAQTEAEILRDKHPTSRAVADLFPAIERRKKEIARQAAALSPASSDPKPTPASDEPSEKADLIDDAPSTRPLPKSTPVMPVAPADEPAMPPIALPEASGLVVPLLRDEQIALMKVYELDLSDNPRVAFPRQFVRQMLEQYAASPLVPTDRLERDALLRQPPVKHVDLMFRLQARDYYDKVQVIDTPAPMRTFRDEVHSIFIVNACSTNSCHGGLEAGRLVLSNYRPNADPSLWTNFYILSNFKNSAGQSLINWEEPQASPLLQYALPRDVSRLPHPRVMRDGQDQWRPALQGPDDRRYAATIHWLSSMYRPRPEYAMEYTPVRPFAPQPLREKPIAPSVPR